MRISPCRMRRLVSLSLGLLSLSFLGRPTSAIYARSEPGEPRSYCTVYHHFVKSAGTTIKDILKSASLKDGLPRPGPCGLPITSTKCADGIQSAAVITGRGELIREPLRMAGRQNCEFFTMMRDPIERLVSVFFYCPTDHDIQPRPSKWCGHSDEQQPATERLLDFARNFWRSRGFGQMSVGLPCPENERCDGKKVGPFYSLHGSSRSSCLDRLDETKERLSTYVAVGIMDHYELSMELFDARVKSPVWNWSNNHPAKNRGETSSVRREVSEWAKSSPEISRLLEADILLYEFAVDLFKNQTSEALGTVWGSEVVPEILPVLAG